MIELCLDKPNDLKLKQVKPLPAPGRGEVKIKILFGGICGSDLRVYRGSIAYAAYPVRPGHELLGTVTEAGAGVSHAVGTRVVVEPNTFCGQCEPCTQGKTNICREKKSLGININGGFGSEFVTEAKYVVAVPDELSDNRAILIEPFAVTVHALKKANLAPGQTVAVVGCGTEGLLAVALAGHLGGDVTVIDVNPRKLEIASRLGKVQGKHPGELKDETFDIVIEAAGVKASVEQAMQLVKPGGVLIAVGITGEPVNYPVIHIVRNEITIYGSIIYTLKDYQEAIEYLKDPCFNVDPVVSQIVPYDQFQQAYDDALTGNLAKIVLDFRRA